jgi:hypothetical protein
MTSPAALPQAAELAAKSGEALKSGPIGLAVILILCIVCYFLFKSMSKHLRNVRDSFPTDPPPPPGKRDGTPLARAVVRPNREVTGAPGAAPDPGPGEAQSSAGENPGH